MAEEDAPVQSGKPVLEDIVDQFTYAGKSLFKIGAAMTPTAVVMALMPGLAGQALAFSTGQISADATKVWKHNRLAKKDSSLETKTYSPGELLKSSAHAALQVPALDFAFGQVHKIPTTSLMGYAAKGAAWGGIAYPIFMPYYMGTGYAVRQRKVSGMGKYLKDNYWSVLTQAWKKLLVPSLANIWFVPAALNLPVSAGITYLFALFGSPEVKGKSAAENNVLPGPGNKDYNQQPKDEYTKQVA